MSKLFLLTSKKVGIKYSITYLIVRLLYIVTPLVTSLLIDAALNQNFKLFWELVVLEIVVHFSSQIFDFLSDYYEEECYANEFDNLIQLINEKVEKFDYRKGELKLNWINQLLGQDFEKANKYFFVNKIVFAYYILSVVIILFIMFKENVFVALCISVLIAICIPLNLKFGNNITDASEATLDKMENIKNMVNDQVIVNKEDRFQNDKQINTNLYSKHLNSFHELFSKKNKATAFYLNIISYGSLNSVIMLAILMCAYFLIKGEIGVGTLYLFQNYTSQLWSPGEYLFEFRSKYKENKPIFNKIDQLYSFDEIDKTKEEDINSIKLVNYHGLDMNGKPLHKDLNVELCKNHVYLVRGDNGAGKTTLIENMLELTKRYDGSILYNDSDEFINNFSYVMSKPYISTYYDDKIVKGSDGQKKIYQLKRCTKDNKNVIIFDEPTNYLDNSNKSVFIDILNEIKKDKIVIVISHDNYLFDLGFDELKLEKNY